MSIIFIDALYNIFLKPSNGALKLIAPCFISILYFIVFLSGSFVTLPSIYSFINSAISVKPQPPGLTVEYKMGVQFLL